MIRQVLMYRGRGVGRGHLQRRGRAAGYTWSSAQRSSRVEADALSKVDRLAAQNATLTKALTPTRGDYIASDIFGTAYTDPRGHDQRQLLIGDQVIITSKAGKAHGDHDVNLDHGLVSIVRSQAKGLEKFLEDASVQWSTNVMDDASMWICKIELEKHVKRARVSRPSFFEAARGQGQECTHASSKYGRNHFFAAACGQQFWWC